MKTAAAPRRSPFRLASLPALALACVVSSPAFGMAGTSQAHSAPGGTVLADPVVDAGSPVAVLSPGVPTVVVPITVTRTANTPVAGISVTFQLTNLNFASGSLGGFLAATGANSSGVFVTSNGGGSYTLDAVTLGSPCGSGALGGTLFNVTVATAATSGAGTLLITQVKLRDCVNVAMPSSIGTPGTVAIDFVGPSITSCAPNQSGSVAAACQGTLPSFVAGVVVNDANGPVVVTQLPLAGSAVPLGVTNVTLTATDALGNTSTCLATYTASDLVAPLVTLDSPNGGEQWVQGSTHDVTWTASDNCALASFDLELSTDDGGSYAPIVSNLAIATSYSWTLPLTLTTQARVRVTVRDTAGNATGDASNASFTIRPTNYAPVLGAIGNKLADELVLSSFTATASDLDAGQLLQYSLDSGAPVGAAIDANSGLFTWTPLETDGPGVYPVTIRVTDNGTPVLDAFETITITVNDVELAAVTLTSTPVLTGHDTDGTTKIHVSWTAQASGSSVAIYRHGFGGYPSYDDAGGVAPAAPGAYPPAGAWVLAGTTAGASFDDEVAWPSRDVWYYAAYVVGPGANVSPVSNLTSGTLNYLLGDVMNPHLNASEAGHGDNIVNLSDVSLLGAHYGLSGVDVVPVGYLDVGPTSSGLIDGRPLTDQSIDFEDLMLLSLNYTMPATLVTAGERRNQNQPLAAARDLTDRLSIEAPVLVLAGETFTARVRMFASGSVQGLSVPLAWDPAIAAPLTTVAGSWLTSQEAVMLVPRPGVVDAAMLGVHETGLQGDGVLAEVTFTALATGDPRVRIGTIKARDAANHPLLLTPLAVDSGALRGATMLWAPTPNPCRSSAQFSVSLAEAGPMDLALYTVDGRRVRTLASGERAAGEHRLSWDGRTDSGQGLGPGVYFARLETRSGRWTRTVALIK